MQCPACKNVNLIMAERQGIEIDYCPQCRGVWLDRGELDKIIERTLPASNISENRPLNYSQHQQNSYKYRDYDDRYYDYHYKKKKKFRFLRDLFDFD